MALALATSPAVVSGSGTTATTASFTPAASSLLVATVCVGNPAGTLTATTGAVTDSLGSTWTMKRRQNSTTGTGSAEVWMLDAGGSPAARTVTLTGSKAGVLLAVTVMSGAAAVAAQTGATAVSASTTLNTVSITPTAVGSYVVGGISDSQVAYTPVAASASTAVGALNDASNGGSYGAFRSTALTSTTSAQTYGMTPAPTNETEKVAVEVLAAAGGPTTQNADATLAATATGTATATSTGTGGAAGMMPYGRNAVGLRGVSQLIVRIGRNVASRGVTVTLPDDAEITWSAPGGDDTFTATIPWPDRGIARPDAFAQNMPLRVEDRRTGEIIWQGRVVDPGFSGDRTRQEFRVSAVGAGHDLDSISVIKMYVDRDPEHWYDLHRWQTGNLTKGDGTGFIANSNDSLQVIPDYYLEFPWPEGTTMAQNAVQYMSYLTGFYAAADLAVNLAQDGRSHGPTAVMPEIHGIRFSWQTSHGPNNELRVIASNAIAGGTITISTGVLWSTATTPAQRDESFRDGLSGSWTLNDVKYLSIGQQRMGVATTMVGPDGWIRFANIHVVGKRYDRYANDTTGARVEALAPYEVVEDLLGTALNGRFDPGTITPDPSILIDHATWWVPTPVSEILDAANGWNNDAWWGVWAPANPDALPRVDYRSWTAAPRYTLDDTAQIALAGGSEVWANSALITYLRGNEVPTVTRATITVPAIGRIFGSTGVGVAAAKTRDLSVDLTDRGPMSKAAAVQVAGQMLAASATERASGSATIRGPLMDDVTGRIVQPWEIRPGWPILVGSTPNQFTAGRPVTFDGESTFRLSHVAYRAADDTATIDLDGGTRRLVRGGPVSAKPKYTYVAQSRRARRRRR